MATNKEILSRGIKYMFWAIPAIFIGPSVINFSFKNKLQPLYPLLLALGIIICITAIYLMFLGIKTIMKSLFDK